jgi:electron transfer flavoprotein-quinone oxidoreductase
LEKFDAIVIGAGPAGSSCAYSLAKDGLQVLLLERGKYAGSKNVFGGRIYPYSLKELIPDYEKDAPIERNVVKEGVTFMTEKSSMSMNFTSSQPYSFTAIRSTFDRWLSDKAVGKGAVLFPETKVDKLIVENGMVKGIKTGADEVLADVVIDCEGTIATLAKQAELRKGIAPEHVSVGVKEVIDLPANTIDERFGLEDGEGFAGVYIGYASNWLRGGAFIYTNKDNVSIGVVVKAVDLVEAKVEAPSIIENFKSHALIKKLLKGGKVVEYSAHTIPEAGLAMVPKLYRNGMLVCGDAAGFIINNGYTFRGVDLAISSGIAAADTVKKAREKSDYTESSLSYYIEALEKRKVLTDLRTFSKAPKYMENRRLYTAYPKLICEVLEEMYGIRKAGTKKVSKIAREKMKGKVSMITLIRDMLAGANAM